MSFKREGDDVGQLGVLRRRRIRELFTEDIPKDEALLMRNGRYACLVCGNRPVFDTVIMLSQHRKGKKHEMYLVKFQEKKKELEALIHKRKHEKFLKEGHTDIEQAKEHHKGLGCGPVYDPRVKKKFQRTRVDLNSKDTCCSLSSHETPSASHIFDLPGARIGCNDKNQSSGSQNKAEKVHTKDNKEKVHNYQSNKNFRDYFLNQKGPIQHPKQLKRIFDGPASNDFTPVPYKRKMINLNEISNPSRTAEKSNIQKGHSEELTNNSSAKENGELFNQNMPSLQSTQSKDKYRDKTRKIHETCVSVNDQEIQAKKLLADKYLYYRGGGWKKDWRGQWVKDEDAEFDSDEEPPDLP